MKCALPRFIFHAGLAVLTMVCFASLARAAEESANSAPVTLAESADAFTLSNGIVTARISKRNGEVASMQYRSIEMIERGYWSFVGRSNRMGSRLSSAVRTDPAQNGGERAEVSCRFSPDGKPGTLPADIDLRYALGRGESGLYAYAVWSHRSGDPGFSIAEARYALKLNPDVFDWMTIDSRRRGAMPAGADWDRGKPLQLKEIREITTGPHAGRVEHKYDYSAVLAETPAYGWSSTAQKVGFWMINPSIEYLSGGPTKVELTGHLDVNPRGLPTLLNMWVGSHYGGSSLAVAPEENWTKCIGPFLLYCNAAPDHDAMWKDALARAQTESQAWPFAWVKDDGFPPAVQRGTVRGQLLLQDPFAPGATLRGAQVGLAAPDYQVSGRRNAASVDWQRDAKFYQFWTRAGADGRFVIPHVRPGSYTLHAFAENVLGEMSKTSVVVKAGEPLDLGALIWIPERRGRALWEIGTPDRTAAEFRHGDDYWHWGLFFKYPQEFPDDVNFIIGKSDPRRDWNYAQPGRGRGDAGAGETVWSIAFELPETPRSGPATLRLAIAGSRTERGVEVLVNDQLVGGTGALPDTGVMHRDGIRGYWCERAVGFDAAFLRAGTNTIKLRLASSSWTQGVLYDYLRLEFADAAPATADASTP